jgi:hypothetical protein
VDLTAEDSHEEVDQAVGGVMGGVQEELEQVGHEHGKTHLLLAAQEDRQGSQSSSKQTHLT